MGDYAPPSESASANERTNSSPLPLFFVTVKPDGGGNSSFAAAVAGHQAQALFEKTRENPVSVRLFGENPVSVRLFGQE